MGSDRRAHTTGLIRAGALAEFSEVGPRALNLQQVAQRSFVSVGAVYERWPNREACVTDVVTSELPVAMTAAMEPFLDHAVSLAQAVRWSLTDEQQLAHMRFAAECVFAARDDAALRPIVIESIREFSQAVLARTDPVFGVGDLCWWIGATWVGYGLLKTSGCPIPDSLIDVITIVVTQMGHLSPEQARSIESMVGDVVFAPQRDANRDSSSEAIVDAARAIITERGVDEANLRAIAQAAGLTTGALYRRFTGRSEVLVKALLASLPSERYAWTAPMLATLEAEGFDGAAEYLASLCERVWTDEVSANTLLEFSVAAHTDANVLAAIFTEMQRVTASRTELFTALADAGVFRRDVPPEGTAWLFQIPPVGMRLLGAIGMTPAFDDLVELLEAYLLFLMASDQAEV